MKKINLKRVLNYLIAGLLIVSGLSLIPVPYVVELPGDAINATEFIQVDGAVEKNSGELLVMTVASYDATLVTALGALLPYHELVSMEEYYGNETNEEYRVIQSYYMENARNQAVYNAYRAAGKEVQLQEEGIFVMSIIPESDFAHKLQVGDVIVAIDQHEYTNTSQLMEYVANKQVKDSVELTVERAGKREQLQGSLIEHPSTGKAALGISLVTKTHLQAQPAVQFESHGIMGPSAGLMFSLEIYDQLTAGDLTKGQKIAGTGTIEQDGTVGRIGGVDKKVVAAARQGATIFFVPDDEVTSEMVAVDPTLQSNYIEAVQVLKKLDSTMKIVPIKSFNDALEYLNQLP